MRPEERGESRSKCINALLFQPPARLAESNALAHGHGDRGHPSRLRHRRLHKRGWAANCATSLMSQNATLLMSPYTPDSHQFSLCQLGRASSHANWASGQLLSASLGDAVRSSHPVNHGIVNARTFV